jgi:TetR/AcrR family transcriptional repressor of nem operon
MFKWQKSSTTSKFHKLLICRPNRVSFVPMSTIKDAAPSRKGAGTKLRIVHAAADLFHKQGVRATSPDEIMEASGTGKGQFYHYFKNKEGLVHGVLQDHLTAIKAGVTPVNYEIESWQDLERWFLTHLELQKRFSMTRGCPFGTMGSEVTENDELIRQDLCLVFEVIRHKLIAFFIKEKAKSRLSKDANESDLADFCLATLQGAMLLGKIERSSRSVEATFRETLAHLQRYAVAGPVKPAPLRTQPRKRAT